MNILLKIKNSPEVLHAFIHVSFGGISKLIDFYKIFTYRSSVMFAYTYFSLVYLKFSAIIVTCLGVFHLYVVKFYFSLLVFPCL